MLLIPRMTKVESTCIDSIKYNPYMRRLDIVFTNGHRYRYEKVPRKVFRDLKNADSIGRYFNKQVRNAYEFEKLF